MVDWPGWEKKELAKIRDVQAEKDRQTNITRWKAEWTARFKSVKGKEYIEWITVYRSYLGSRLWEEIKQQAIFSSNGKCLKCNEKLVDPDVHHKNYNRVGGNELPSDLEVLCSECHLEKHKELKFDREERWKNERYLRRLDGFAKGSSKHGEMWWFHEDEDAIELEFIKFLYRKMLKEDDYENSDEYEDPENYTDFYTFWADVLNGKS